MRYTRLGTLRDDVLGILGVPMEYIASVLYGMHLNVRHMALYATMKQGV